MPRGSRKCLDKRKVDYSQLRPGELTIAKFLAGYDDATWGKLADSRKKTYIRAAGSLNFWLGKRIDELGADHNLEYCDCEFCLLRSEWHRIRAGEAADAKG